MRNRVVQLPVRVLIACTKIFLFNPTLPRLEKKNLLLNKGKKKFESTQLLT